MVGLGNPGAQYTRTRHNIGRMVVDELAARSSARFTSHRAGAMLATVPGPPRMLLAAPTTFMNVSGPPVGALMRFFKVDPARLIVVHDELDLPFDTVRLKAGGGHGGHNGLRDVIRVLTEPDFVRVRVGIGRPPGRQPAADFVLRDFSGDERAALPNLVADAADAVELVVRDGLTSAQQRVHAPR